MNHLVRSLIFGAPSVPATCTITSNESDFTDATPFEIQITFDKPRADLVVGDLNNTNSTLSSFANSGDDLVYTCDVTPDLSGDITLSIDADVTAEGNEASNLVTVTSDLPGKLLDEYPGAYTAIGMVLLRSAYTGDCIRIRRTDTDAETDIGFSGGIVDIAAINTFRSGADVVIVTMYDQSGNGNDWTQSDPAKHPPISSGGTLNLVNGIPATMSPDKNIYDLFLTDNSVSSASVFVVAKPNGLFATLIGGQTGSIYSGLMQGNSGSNAAHNGAGDCWVNGVSNTFQRNTLSAATVDTHCVISMIDLDMSTYTSFHTNYISHTGFDSADNMQAIIMYQSDKTSDRVGIETIITDEFIT